MASKGMISVVSEGNVVMKIITGCFGYNAYEVSKVLKKNWPIDIYRAYDFALYLQFGATDSLVVMNENDIQYHGTDKIKDNYRNTFNYPDFNPCWEDGDDNHVVIIEV